MRRVRVEHAVRGVLVAVARSARCRARRAAATRSRATRASGRGSLARVCCRGSRCSRRRSISTSPTTPTPRTWHRSSADERVQRGHGRVPLGSDAHSRARRGRRRALDGLRVAVDPEPNRGRARQPVRARVRHPPGRGLRIHGRRRAPRVDVDARAADEGTGRVGARRRDRRRAPAPRRGRDAGRPRRGQPTVPVRAARGGHGDRHRRLAPRFGRRGDLRAGRHAPARAPARVAAGVGARTQLLAARSRGRSPMPTSPSPTTPPGDELDRLRVVHEPGALRSATGCFATPCTKASPSGADASCTPAPATRSSRTSASTSTPKPSCSRSTRSTRSGSPTPGATPASRACARYDKYANAEASELLERALDRGAAPFDDDAPAADIAEVWETLGDARRACRVLRRRRRAYRTRRRLAAGDPPGVASLLVKEAVIAERTGHYRRVITTVRRGSPPARTRRARSG